MFWEFWTRPPNCTWKNNTYILGEISSSGGATLYKNPSDQTVKLGKTQFDFTEIFFSIKKSTNLGYDLDPVKSLPSSNQSWDCYWIWRHPQNCSRKIRRVHNQYFWKRIPNPDLAISACIRLWRRVHTKIWRSNFACGNTL